MKLTAQECRVKQALCFLSKVVSAKQHHSLAHRQLWLHPCCNWRGKDQAGQAIFKIFRSEKEKDVHQKEHIYNDMPFL